MADNPSPTDAELDEIEAAYSHVAGIEDRRVTGLCEALRACRTRSKAKDALLREVYEAYLCSGPGGSDFEWVSWAERVEAALDKGVGDADTS